MDAGNGELQHFLPSFSSLTAPVASLNERREHEFIELMQLRRATPHVTWTLLTQLFQLCSCRILI